MTAGQYPQTKPTDGTCPRYSRTSRCRSTIVTIINTYIIKVLRRPVESGQFTSWAFTRRALDSGLVPSMGSIGDCFDCEHDVGCRLAGV